MEEIALDAGIDPVNLRRAAAEVENRASASGLATVFLGTSPTISMERIIRGEIADDVFEILLPRPRARWSASLSTRGRAITTFTFMLLPGEQST